MYLFIYVNLVELINQLNVLYCGNIVICCVYIRIILAL